ncbi:hypothetical protein DF133_20535 [Burkholderia cenocepacia]|nr:hypothetical protein DF133_20535 [Burkholderia cenocepacia]
MSAAARGCSARTRAPGNRVAPLPAAPSTPHPTGDLRGNRLYTLLPGRTGRASGHSLYSRRVRHPDGNPAADTLPMQETS